MANQEKLKKLGFDDAFIRKWEYYFHYCEVGFKLRVLGDLQIVYSKAANLDLNDAVESELCATSRGLEHFMDTNASSSTPIPYNSNMGAFMGPYTPQL
jgi:hypothetical protein